MTGAPRPTHLSTQDLELLDIKVTRDGGAVRYLEGAKYGLVTSIYRSECVPGSGPAPHTHPHAEFFVLNEAGDVVIVPAGLVRSFINPGTSPLRQTAIHEASVHAMARAAGHHG